MSTFENVRVRTNFLLVQIKNGTVWLGKRGHQYVIEINVKIIWIFERKLPISEKIILDAEIFDF